MENLFKLIEQTNSNIDIKVINELWNKSYSQVTFNRDGSICQLARFEATSKDGSKAKMRAFYTGSFLELITLLPEDWEEIKLMTVCLGKTSNRVAIRNNWDGSATVYKTNCFFKPGELISAFDHIRIIDVTGIKNFIPDRSNGFLEGWLLDSEEF